MLSIGRGGGDEASRFRFQWISVDHCSLESQRSCSVIDQRACLQAGGSNPGGAIIFQPYD